MKVILIIFSSVLLLSCNELKEGDVIQKWYEPATGYFIMMPIVMTDGKTTTTMYVNYWIDDNEDWVVKIKGKCKGKEMVQNVYVSKKQYECLQNGSHLVIGTDCSLEDNNNLKTPKQ